MKDLLNIPLQSLAQFAPAQLQVLMQRAPQEHSLELAVLALPQD